jgi:hypothetical protein
MSVLPLSQQYGGSCRSTGCLHLTTPCLFPWSAGAGSVKRLNCLLSPYTSDWVPTITPALRLYTYCTRDNNPLLKSFFSASNTCINRVPEFKARKHATNLLIFTSCELHQSSVVHLTSCYTKPSHFCLSLSLALDFYIKTFIVGSDLNALTVVSGTFS